MSESNSTSQSTVRDEPVSSNDQIEAAAMFSFEAGQFAAAHRGFQQLFEAGVATPDHVETLAALHVEAGENILAGETLSTYLDQHAGDILPRDWTKLARLHFESSISSSDPDERRKTALGWLEAIAREGNGAWRSLVDPDVRSKFEVSFAEPQHRLEWLEYLTYAPAETCLPEQAVTLIEEFGHSNANNPVLAREAERLLHALGARDAAYRVEVSRRSRAPKPKSTIEKKAVDDALDITGQVIAIAGGHPALRQLIRTDLVRAGAKGVREIPPRWEGNRSGREITAVLTGAEVAVLIGRYIAHSTVDQIKHGAEQVGVPVITALTASTSGVRRALALRARSRLDKPSRPT